MKMSVDILGIQGQKRKHKNPSPCICSLQVDRNLQKAILT